MKIFNIQTLTPFPSPANRGRGGRFARFFYHTNIFLIVFIAICSLSTVLCPLAFANGEAGQDLPVLEIGAGARPLGMGGAFSTITGDVNSYLYNPAGISKLASKQIITTQGDLFIGTKFYSLTYGQPLTEDDGFAVSWMRLVPADQDLVSSQGTIEGAFSAKDEAIVLSYGKTFSPISVGINGKYITRSLHNATGSGIGFDLGIYYQASPLLSYALVAKDINETRIFWSNGGSDKVLSSINIGFGFKPFENLNLAGDFGKKIKGNHSIQAKLGAEWRPLDMLALRAGMDEGQAAGGVSLKLSSFQIDYAYVNHIDLGGTSKVSLCVLF